MSPSKARWLSVRPVIDGRTARASTNRLDADSIRDVVEQAIAITRLSEPDPELLPLADPAEYAAVRRHFEATARATPEERALAVAEAIGVVEDAGQTAAGIYSTGDSTFALLNSQRRPGVVRRDPGALLDHGHGRGQFRLGQGQRLLPWRSRSAGSGACGRAQSSASPPPRANCPPDGTP